MAEVAVGGTRFHVQRLGSAGPAVAFIHGLVMDNLSSWYFTLANPVATLAEVLLYDLRGHGRSERTATGYGVERMVADLHGVLEAGGFGGRPVTLVGNSFGGLLALVFAAAHPRRVAGLVLVDAQLPDREWAAGMQRTLRLTGRERDWMIAQSFRNWLGRHSPRKRTRLAEVARGLVYETSLVDDLGSTPELGPSELAAIACPTLAVYGQDSDIRSHGERLAATLPDCELRLFPGCTHSVIWEATELLRETVLDWLARRVARPAARS
jgi:pimeloyl-ACP methyl ester carboxylesterase